MKLQTLANLSTLYSEGHRHYHNLNHINHCLGEYEKYKLENPTNSEIDNVVKTSIWWHDAIYNPYSSENEKQSAELFSRSLEQNEKHWYFNDTINDIILMTAKHTLDQKFENMPSLTQECAVIVLDLDLSSMGSSESSFKCNGENIRKEFNHVPDIIFYENRIKFLEAMLARKSIFYTKYFFDKYEDQARSNIKDSIVSSDLALTRAKLGLPVYNIA
jgi:predicted metal-dependent HD superfamily phosphohydrolase